MTYFDYVSCCYQINDRNDIPDRDLLRRIVTGDRPAYTTLYDRYKQGLFTIVAERLSDPQDAEDILLEVFLKLWTSRDRLDAGENLTPYP